ncbi:hypothetical protein A2U01_0073861, partial [Trifolium medium]|nr:hypothetical protein [Trifolium medium]
AGGTLRHDTEQVWRSFSQLCAAQEGWRVAPVSAEELESFGHLRVAQERTARCAKQLGSLHQEVRQVARRATSSGA